VDHKGPIVLTAPPVSEVFEPGSVVTIDFIDERGSFRKYDTKLRLIEKDVMQIVSPLERGMPVRPAPGVELRVMHAAGQMAYVGRVKVIRLLSGPPPMIVTSVPKELSVQPRRRFFRVDVEIPFRASFCKGAITNASAGGFLLRVDSDCFSEGTYFDIKFPVPPAGIEATVRVKVVRTFQHGRDHYAGVALDRVSKQVEDDMIKFLLAKQRELVSSSRATVSETTPEKR
jgi:hypothetical protein